VKKVSQRRYTIDLTNSEDEPVDVENEMEKVPNEGDSKEIESQEEIFEDEDVGSYYGHP
jgi:hypothetical protein